MRYGLRSDEVQGLGTWTTVTGTELTQYEASHLVTDLISKPVWIEETSGLWRGDFTARPGGKQRVDAVVIPMHNITAGLDVRIPGLNTVGVTILEAAITIPAYRGDGYPLGAWLDLTGDPDYTTNGFAYWELEVVGVNAVPLALKLRLLAALQTMDPNISWDAAEGEDRAMIEHQSEYEVPSTFDLGVTMRDIAGELDSPDTQKALVRALWQSVLGRVHPFVLIPDGAVNDAWIVLFREKRLEVVLRLTDRNTIRVAFDEISRGLVF